MSAASSSTSCGTGTWFTTTHWSVVLSAGAKGAPESGAALEKLCDTYWPPLYAYVRRRGWTPADAQDLTQEFFARLLARNRIAGVSPSKGRFRSFLLASMNHFLSDAWDKARAQKRGGGKNVPLDLQVLEAQLAEIADPGLTPERVYEQRWAVALLEQVYARLAEEYRQTGKGRLFEGLRSTLNGSGRAAPYVELGRQIELSEGAVKVAVHRLRHRYRELLRATIAETVSGPEEVEDELRYLLRVVAGEQP